MRFFLRSSAPVRIGLVLVGCLALGGWGYFALTLLAEPEGRVVAYVMLGFYLPVAISGVLLLVGAAMLARRMLTSQVIATTGSVVLLGYLASNLRYRLSDLEVCGGDGYVSCSEATLSVSVHVVLIALIAYLSLAVWRVRPSGS